MSRRSRKSSRPALGRASRPRDRIYSGPDIKLGYARVGQDTLAAIAEELNAAGRGELTPKQRVRALARAASAPEIAVRETLAGRETLGAIAQELRGVATRAPMNTKPYGDRISNAPGATTPAMTIDWQDSGPEISVRPTSVGRETMAAIHDELQQEHSDEPTTGLRTRHESEGQGLPNSEVRPAESRDAIEVFEMMTFVARGEVAQLASTSVRRDFVEEHLMHRLPVSDISEVDRIDVTPWTVKGTVIIRVWCRVPANEAPSRSVGGQA